MRCAWPYAVLAGTLGACAQDPAPPPPQAAAAASQDPQALVAELARQGIRVDLAAGTVELDATVNQPADPLEYLLIHRRGKAHEALLLTDVKPSLLASALLLLGLAPGRNARTEPIEPPPTEEEIAKGAEWVKVIPPAGTPLWLSVRWHDEKAGAVKTVAVEDLLLDITTEKPLAGGEWIFLGGRMAPLYRGDPPVYVADYEGNLISVCYLAPDNHLATLKHERARDDQNWWMTEECPPPGTKVTLCVHKEKPAVVLEREKRPGAARAKAEPERGKEPGK